MEKFHELYHGKTETHEHGMPHDDDRENNQADPFDISAQIGGFLGEVFAFSHCEFPSFPQAARMKHYILLSVTLPRRQDTDHHDAWSNLLQQLAELEKTSEGIERLAPNTWLLPRDAGMLFASVCIAAASRNDLHHRIWFLNGDD